jgi:hypothetical protein
MKSLLSTLIVLFITANFFSNAQVRAVDTNDFSKLKAVLIIGHQEDLTDWAMEKMNEIADILDEKGVVVHKFYDDKAIWDDIVVAATGANFFIYGGHGSNLGKNGGAGGICVEPTVGPTKMIEELKLHPNAIVIFKSVCRGAGSSAGDDSDIGILEARKRITDYSNPFFEIGAVAYYANNVGGGCHTFLENFLSGKTLKECYEKSAGRYKLEASKAYTYDNSKQLSVSSSPATGITTRTSYKNGKKKVERIPTIKEYSIAYVGVPEYSIREMMGQ